VSNDLRLNYSNQRVGTLYFLDDFGGAVPLSDSVLFPAGSSSADSIFGLLIPGAGQYNQGKAATDEQRQFNVVDSLSMITGHHQLKFGADYRWLAPFSSPYAYRQYVQFSGLTSAPGGALSGTAAAAGTFTAQANALLSQNFSLYGQDTWKITPRWTVTYGLRWGVNPALTGKNAANDPFTVLGLDDPATMRLAPRGTKLYQTTYGNVAPRLGVTYQVGRAVLRGGFGVFYDLGSGSLGGASSYFPYLASKVMPGVAFPLSARDAAGPAISLTPPVAVLIVADPHLELPRSYQWNVAWEQALGNDQTVSLTYVGAIGRDLLRVTHMLAPNPSFQFVGLTDNSATSDYHALQVKLNRRLSHGLQGLASYTFSHSIDLSSSDAFAHYLNTPDSIGGPQLDRGDSDFDVRHAFTVGLTYEVPSPAGRTARALLAGWSLSGFVYARSAPPVDIAGGVAFMGGLALRFRPNVNPGVPLELHDDAYPGGRVFNKAAFTPAPAGHQGNLGRNVLRGFGASQADIAVQRRFHVSHSAGLMFRAEMFNVFNHANFGSPIGDLSSPLFGRSTQTLASSLGTGGANGGLNPLYQIGGPRSIQLALKLQF
jgi:hypothetical protein